MSETATDDVSGTVTLTVNRDMPWSYAARRTAGVWHLWDPEVHMGADWIDPGLSCWRLASAEETSEIEAIHATGRR